MESLLSFLRNEHSVEWGLRRMRYLWNRLSVEQDFFGMVFPFDRVSVGWSLCEIGSLCYGVLCEMASLGKGYFVDWISVNRSLEWAL